MLLPPSPQVAKDPRSTCAHLLAAITPCMRLYAFLGVTISKAFPPPHDSTALDTPYRSWLDTYSSSDFESAAAHVEQLLDHYAGLQPDEYDSLLRNYRTAMALEYSFFDANGEEAGLQGDPAALQASALATRLPEM